MVYPTSPCRRILAKVTPLQRYIAEEIATDHVDGLLSRREALRRLALLGVGTAAASALIAACAEGKEPAANAPVTSSEPATASAPPPGSENALPTAPVTWAGPQGELQGAWAEAPNAKGGVLVIHENKGLNDYVRSVAGRFAGIGYSALAIDLLSARAAPQTSPIRPKPPRRWASFRPKNSSPTSSRESVSSSAACQTRSSPPSDSAWAAD